jgi:hypothetical protein
MLNGIVARIRRWNRARLEQRQLASGQRASGPFRRLLEGLRARNHARLARRRARRDLLSSLAANDTALLEALVFLLRSARQEQEARAAAHDAIQGRLSALDARVDEGMKLLAARLQTLEVKLVAARRVPNEVAEPASLAPSPGARAGPSNGELPRLSTAAEPAVKRAEPDAPAGPAPGGGWRRS